MQPVTTQEFLQARARMGAHVHRTPLLTSRTLSDASGFEVRLKAELFQRTGSYKIRGPLNKFAQLSEDEKRRGVICSSAGNHAQGVALAARIHGIHAVVCMAANADAVEGRGHARYGAEVVLHRLDLGRGERARQSSWSPRRATPTCIPFDDRQLMTGQGTVGPRDRRGLARRRRHRRADRRRRVDLRAWPWRAKAANPQHPHHRRRVVRSSRA
jgi:threonine dehydratase